jgi:hypothetical protein
VEHMTQFQRNTPDIITITDNYLKGDINQNLFPIPTYTSIHKQDVSVYHKSNLHVTTITDIHIRQVHSIIIQIHNTPAKTDASRTVISIYRRPKKTDKTFIHDLSDMIDKIRARTPRTTIDIQGDMNINLLRLTPALATTTTLLSHGLRTTITTPTRYNHRRHTATLIDWNITTSDANITAGTVSPPLADHLATLTIHHKHTHRQKVCQTRKLTHHHYMKHREEILRVAKEEIRTSMPTGPAPNNDTAQALLDALARTTRRFATLPRKKRKPWCNPTIRKGIRRQHRLHRKMKADPTPHNIKKHKQFRNKLRKACLAAKRAELRKALDNTKGDPKAQWTVIRTLIPDASKTRASPTRLTHNGTTYTDPKEIADLMNDHYITIGRRTAQTIPPQTHDPVAHKPTTAPSFTLAKTTLRTVAKLMNTLDRHKASDIYGIKPSLIRDLTPTLAPILTDLFNRAIEESTYPDALKLTKVIELYKSKDTTLAINYRPISLLPIIAKLLDKIVNTQLMDHLLTNNLISPTQYAFRPGSNTTMALQSVLSDIHTHRKKRKPTLAVYVDLSKAYDTISHKRLIHKLKHKFNFAPGTLAFFASYFTDRRQSTHTQHAQSNFRTITDGIPQGSTLSTTLFLLYINDIIETVPKSTVFTYADDTTLVITAPTLPELAELAQGELTGLISYFHSNYLVPNPEKTTYSIFYPKTATQIPLTIGTEQLDRVAQAKLLGVFVEENLKHHKTVNKIVQKLGLLAHAFSYAAKLLPQHIMKRLYDTHVYPHLIYAIPIWGTDKDNAGYLRPLRKAHKRLVRTIRNVPARAHTKPIMTELDILTIPNLYTLRVCTEMHPFVHTDAPQHRLNRSKPMKRPVPKPKPTNRPQHVHHYARTTDVHKHMTRRARKAGMHLARSNNIITQRYADVWNALPSQIREIKSTNTFKTVLKTHLMEKQNSS